MTAFCRGRTAHAALYLALATAQLQPTPFAVQRNFMLVVVHTTAGRMWGHVLWLLKAVLGLVVQCKCSCGGWDWAWTQP